MSGERALILKYEMAICEWLCEVLFGFIARPRRARRPIYDLRASAFFRWTVADAVLIEYVC